MREQAVHAHVLEERAKALGEQLAAESGSAQTLRTMMESAQHELKTTSASCDALRAESATPSGTLIRRRKSS